MLVLLLMLRTGLAALPGGKLSGDADVPEVCEAGHFRSHFRRRRKDEVIIRLFA